MCLMNVVYIKDDVEVFEVREEKMYGSTFISKDVLERKEYELGENLLNFVYGNFETEYNLMSDTNILFKRIRSKDNADNIIPELKNISNTLKKSHIFFSPAASYIDTIIHERETTIAEERPKEFKVQVSYLSNLWYVLRDLQEKLYKLLDECLNLDINNHLTIEQRYSKYLSEDSKISAFIPKMPTTQLEIMPKDNSYIEQVKQLSSKNNFSEDTIKDIDISFVAVAEPKSSLEYIYYFVGYFLTNKIQFRKCKNCGKFFIPLGNLGYEYCNRLAENSTKTCREIGPVRVYQEKAFDNPIAKLYNRAYKKYFARIKYKMLTKEEFDIWAKEARKQRDKAIAGEISIDDFQQWLDNSK